MLMHIRKNLENKGKQNQKETNKTTHNPTHPSSHPEINSMNILVCTLSPF